MMRKKVSKKRFLCSVFSLSTIILLTVIALNRGEIYDQSGDHYWNTILVGPGREVRRFGDSVYYIGNLPFDWGWRHYRTTAAKIEDAGSASLRLFINEQFWYKNSERRHPRIWILREIQALLGRDLEEPEEETLAWWMENRDNFIVTDKAVAALMEERRAQMEMLSKLNSGEFLPPDPREHRWSILRERVWFQYLHSDEGKSVISLWRPYDKARYNLGFEAVFFTLFIYLVGYGTPWLNRRMRMKRIPVWIRMPVLSICIYTAFIFPFLFGYLPTTDVRARSYTKTLLYEDLFYASCIPLFISAAPLRGLAPSSLEAIFPNLDFMFPPILRYFNDPRIPFDFSDRNYDLSIHLALGNLTYGAIGFLIGSVNWVFRKNSDEYDWRDKTQSKANNEGHESCD